MAAEMDSPTPEKYRTVPDSPHRYYMTDQEWDWAKRERNRAAKTARAARLLTAREAGTHTDDQWYAICQLVGMHCVRCLAHCPDGLTRDHIVPLYRGGSDHISNIQPLCRQCNSGKPLDEHVNWVQRRLGVG